RVIVRVSESVPMIEEEFNRLDRNGKTKPFSEGDLHIGDANDFAGEVEQRAATVPGIDLSGGLKIKLAAKLPRFGAQNSLRHSAFQAERTADRKHSLACGKRIGAAH